MALPLGSCSSIHTGFDANYFSLSSIDVTNGIRAGRSDAGITFIWHRNSGCNIQVKRYEAKSIFGLSVQLMGRRYYLLMSISQSLVIQIMRTILCALVYLVPYLNPMRRIMYA